MCSVLQQLQQLEEWLWGWVQPRRGPGNKQEETGVRLGEIPNEGRRNRVRQHVFSLSPSDLPESQALLAWGVNNVILTHWREPGGLKHSSSRQLSRVPSEYHKPLVWVKAMLGSSAFIFRIQINYSCI
jgi:hypothetical protein